MKRVLILLLFIFCVSTVILSQTLTVFSEGYIVGDFNGWNGETLFEMSDGKFWIKSSNTYLYHYSTNPKAMIIQHGAKYYLKVEGIKEMIPVLPIDIVIKSQINGKFEGFKGNTLYKLMNGTVWQQIDGMLICSLGFFPQAIVYKIGSNWKMTVQGITVSVVQLR